MVGTGRIGVDEQVGDDVAGSAFGALGHHGDSPLDVINYSPLEEARMEILDETLISEIVRGTLSGDRRF